MSSQPVDLIQAIEWLQHVRSEPDRVRRVAQEALDKGMQTRETASVLHAVICRGLLDVADAEGALVASKHATDLDSSALDATVRAEVWALHSAALLAAGRIDEAHLVLETAEDLLDGADRGLLGIQRGAVLYRAGDLDQALDALDQAIDRLPLERPIDRGRALNNRAVVQLYLGALAESERDFDQAELLLSRAGLRFATANLGHNRAMVYARMGDIPRALRAFEDAERVLRELGAVTDQRAVARAEILIMAGLAEDVRDLMPEAVAKLDRAGMVSDADEGRLYLAMALRTLGDTTATEAARDAAESFERAGRTGWAAIARHEWLHAHADTSASTIHDLLDAETVCGRLDAHGMQVFAAGAWLRVARLALAIGEPDRATAALNRVRRRRGSPAVRVAAFEAAAMYHALTGNRVSARRAIHAGLRLIELHRSVFAATELRAQVSSWAGGLAKLDVELSWNSGGIRLLRAAERWRSAATRRRSLVPNAPELAALLSDYRATQGVSALVRHEREGLDASARAVAAERRLTLWLRSEASAETRPPALPELRLGELRQWLAGRTLVELIQNRDEVRAVVVGVRTTAVVDLGSATLLADRARQSATVLRQLCSAFESRGGELLARSARVALDRLQKLIAAPLRPHLDEADSIVVVPTADLQTLPWGYLLGPSHRISVTPSVRTIMSEHTSAGTGVVCVAGPGLPGADHEARSISAVHHSSQLIVGAQATVRRFIATADGSRLTHVAAHAQFRAANPLFSHLLLADGPVTAHDLERLAVPPHIIVLSGCSTGLVGPRAGGDLLGLSTALLAGGTATLVVSVLPLPDRACVQPMVELHQQLLSSASAAEAVRAVTRTAAAAESPIGLVTSCALLCIGDGDTTLG